jgi:tRNA-dihydrouridine synthase
MLSFKEKIHYLESYLAQPNENYTDSFKEEISMFIDDFTDTNNFLHFLNKLNSFEEIENWVEKLCSRILLKFDSKGEEINDFIYDYIQLG